MTERERKNKERKKRKERREGAGKGGREQRSRERKEFRGNAFVSMNSITLVIELLRCAIELSYKTGESNLPRNCMYGKRIRLKIFFYSQNGKEAIFSSNA